MSVRPFVSFPTVTQGLYDVSLASVAALRIVLGSGTWSARKQLQYPLPQLTRGLIALPPMVFDCAALHEIYL